MKDGGPMMPMMLDYRERQAYPDCPKSVPFAMLDEKMANRVHSQTLKRLSERGGLAPQEMLALMTGQNLFSGEVCGIKLYGMPTGVAVAEIKKMLAEQA